MTPEEIALEAVMRMTYPHTPETAPESWHAQNWDRLREDMRGRVTEAGMQRQYQAVLWALQQDRAACIAACLGEQVVGVGDPGSPQGHYNRACADCAWAIEERGRG